MSILSTNTANLLASTKNLILLVIINMQGDNEDCKSNPQKKLHRIIFLGVRGQLFQRLHLICQLTGENYGQISTYRL